MSLEADIRDYLRGEYPNANVFVASQEEDAAPPDRVTDGTPDEIHVKVETQPVNSFGGGVLWHESTVTIDIRSFDERRAKAMSQSVHSLSGTRAFNSKSVNSESSSWDVERIAEEQFRTIETFLVRT